MIYNPYNNYDKGMDDAYLGYEPQNTDSKQYMVGYEYASMLIEEQEDKRSVAKVKTDKQC